MNDITQVLQAIRSGDGRASEELLPLVYNELRQLAAARMNHEASGQTLQATALVHEAWLRMVGDSNRTWQNRAHFFGAAAEAMRRILVENARRKSRLKRGGGQIRLDIESLDLAATSPDDKVLLMDEALEQLRAQDPEKARIVVMKFFWRIDEPGSGGKSGRDGTHGGTPMGLCESVAVPKHSRTTLKPSGRKPGKDE